MLDLIDDEPDIQDLITEDDTPVDNLFSEKEQRLLTEPLYSSWSGPGEGRLFLASANVGIFSMVRLPPIVPDMFLSLDVKAPENWWDKAHRSYFIWEFGKPPELAVEIVSNREGGEDGERKLKYQRMRVSYYVIHDPFGEIMPESLTIYRLDGDVYGRDESARFPSLGLGLTLWEGIFEGQRDTWLRWTDADGVLIPTGKERADAAQQAAVDARREAVDARREADEEHRRAVEAVQEAAEERRRADEAVRNAAEERHRADAAQRQLELLRARMRQAGMDPDPG
jgi:Uma2 family endonuclease